MTAHITQVTSRAATDASSKKRTQLRHASLKLVVPETNTPTLNRSKPQSETEAVFSRQTSLQAYQEAENALSMALHYLRASVSNIPGATRKAVQALAALNALHAADTVHGQHIGNAN